MQDSAGPQFVRGGYRNGTSPYNQGTNGNHWSSSAYTSATSAYDLLLLRTNSTVYPAHNSGKSYGFSLRCLAQ